jgi:hypothetical protein
MGRGKYDPASFSNAMGVFKEHLRQNSPEILQILQTPTIGFQYTPEAFVYFFMDQDRESSNAFQSHRLLMVLRDSQRPSLAASPSIASLSQQHRLRSRRDFVG